MDFTQLARKTHTQIAHRSRIDRRVGTPVEGIRGNSGTEVE